MKKVFLFVVLAVFAAASGFAQGFQGAWNGALNVSGLKLRIVFHIEENGGACTAAMDSPDQGVKGIPVTAVEINGDTIRLKIDNMALVYTGTLSGDALTGVFTQGSFSTPLNLERGAIVTAKRPQDPQEPYPYRSETVTFANKEAGISLAGTFTIPREGTNFPAVVLISGSGPQNRDEEVLPMNHRPFLVLSDYLTRRGIAVLRYDDRGVAESTGDYKTATLDDFASDAKSAMDYLRIRPEVNPEKTGLVGHSEGGSIAFLLASVHPEVAYVVSMAGMAVRGDSLLRVQRRLLSQAQGVPDEFIAVNEQLIEKITAMIASHPAAYVSAHIDSLAEQFWATEKPLIERLQTVSPNPLSDEVLRREIKTGFMQFISPELRSLLQCDPSEALTKIQCPVFALNGEKDLQVPADMNLNHIRERVKNVKIKKYSGLNHLFQHAGTGAIGEYGVIEETIAPEALEDIADWIREIAADFMTPK
ncbi:MAG: alpha/beta hydrolase [Dysgonamonadaceae bacterium]|jgi:pimeloyl-ACP methyl ester carboxylesterase|nr:alpha/beta hydrolase [Dysgonamonadaceae bacterium]